MNPSELRLGNYVIRKLYEPERIDNQHRIDINDFYWDQESGDIDYWNNFNPIPLTEEWLLKFGFIDDNNEERQKYKWTYINWLLHNGKTQFFRVYQELSYNYPEFTVYCNQVYVVEIKYVHQLQNLYFALTGEELQCAELVVQ